MSVDSRVRVNRRESEVMIASDCKVDILALDFSYTYLASMFQQLLCKVVLVQLNKFMNRRQLHLVLVVILERH